jgi:4-oxalomesaconate tautomerase
MTALRAVWVEAGLRMALKGPDGRPMTADQLAHSETIPKVCIVGPPQSAGHIAVRYFTPQAGHRSMAVSGGCCLAAAALIPGSVAHGIARGLPPVGAAFGEVDVGIENPAGVLEATIDARMTRSGLEVRRAAYRRSTQILLRGHVPLYRASDALRNELRTVFR